LATKIISRCVSLLGAVDPREREPGYAGVAPAVGCVGFGGWSEALGIEAKYSRQSIRGKVFEQQPMQEEILATDLPQQ
jgi:hypothetical protein